MIQVLKYFSLSFFVVMLSLFSADVASAKVKRSKKIAKVYAKSKHQKKKRAPKKKTASSRKEIQSPQKQGEIVDTFSEPAAVENMSEASSAPEQSTTEEVMPSATSQENANVENMGEASSTPEQSTTEEVMPSATSEENANVENMSEASSTPEQSTTEEIMPSATSEENANVENMGEASSTPEQSQENPTLTEQLVEPVKEKTPAQALAAEPPAPVIPNSESQEASREDCLTLKDALEGAYTQSPLLTAEYQVKEAQMRVSGAKREWLPKTGATLAYSGSTGDYVSSRGLLGGQRSDSSGNTKSAATQGSLTLQQNLYSGGATVANITAQEKTLTATVAAYMSTLRDTLISAIKSFIDLSTKQEVFRLNKASQALLERHLDVAQNRYEFGELTRYDVAAAQAKLDKAKAEVIAALSEAEMAKATFVKVTGINVEKTLEKPKDPSHLIPATKAEAIQIALKSSPDLHKQEALAEAAQAETDRTFGGLLPSFDINASASRKLSDNWDKNSYFGGRGSSRREELEGSATLSIPLDFRGTTQSSVRQQKYAAAQKRLSAIYERRNVMELVSKYWDALEAARARINQIKSQVTASKIAVETVTEEFLAGNKTTLDVLTAEQELFSAQVDLVNAEHGVILNAYQLLATMGRLNTETLELNVNVYDPRREYDEMPFWGIGIKQDDRIEAQELSTSLMKGAEATQ